MAQQYKSAETSSEEALDSYENRFLEILNNRGKSTKGRSVRHNGFVVLVRGRTDLTALQSLCHRQTWNTCLTARYRLRPEAPFGTLFAAFLSDLRRLQVHASVPVDEAPVEKMQKLSEAPSSQSELNLLGEISPEATGGDWQGLIQGPLGSWLASWSEAEQGALDRDRLSELMKILSDEEVLSTGKRLVLLGEVSGESEDLAGWEQAHSAMFSSLPERFGLVLAGAPETFHLPGDNLHFLIFDLSEEEVSRESRDVEKQQRFRPSALQSDLPARQDHLGVDDYARVLARFVLHPETQPPLTLGIHGPWGKGKSSFMQLVERALVTEAAPNRGERTQQLADLQAEIERNEKERAVREPEEEQTKAVQALERQAAERDELWRTMKRDAEKEALTVWFNAWRYEDARQIWAGLAHVIGERLERVLPWSARWSMSWTYAWKEHRAQFLMTLVLPALAALLVAGGLVIWGVSQEEGLVAASGPIEQLIRVIFPVISTIGLFWVIAWRAMKVVQPVSERVLGYVQRSDHREQMGYQHEVMSDLRFLYDRVLRHQPEAKVVVFIDDLDRCSEDKIMDVLQAIHLILGNSRFVVFLGMDTGMIYRAIRVHYSKYEKTEPLPPRFPEDYLRKIIQLSFHLPPTPPDDQSAFLDTLFSARAQAELNAAHAVKQETGPSAAEQGVFDGDGLPFDLTALQDLVPQQLEETEDTAEELKAFRDYQRFVEDNPREIKRLINVHRLVKIFIQRQNREVSWSAERQRKLVKWRVFCARWPDLVDNLLHFAETTPDSENCMLGLAKKMEISEEMEAFATHKDVLSAEDVDDDLRLAAHISRMVRNTDMS